MKTGIEILRTQKKPPLGIKPKWLHDEHRLNEIIFAIGRFVDAGETVPQEWLIEFNELVKRDKRFIME